MSQNSLDRFSSAHERDYNTALAEIQSGRKISHWMWYIFPQLKGLGHSSTSEYYGISDLEEAKAYLNDKYLGAHLLEITSALLLLDCDDAHIVMGSPDDMKLKSSMTLFWVAAPQEKVFFKVLEKFFSGQPDYRTLEILGVYKGIAADSQHRSSHNNSVDRIFQIQDDNIRLLRQRYPDGLHFVVGDTHGEYASLCHLMDKIEFDPHKDHVYFVGDYNAGGNIERLLEYIAQYYQEDYSIPGFHLIRGNHERELCPRYSLQNLPDIIVIRGRIMNYYVTHAGMVSGAFDLINEDLRLSPQICAYALDENVACYDAPFRQIIWSRRGLYSQKSRYHTWPSVSSLHEARACIIHGHTPFSMLKNGHYFSYGDEMLFWENQRIWFAEDLQSFDIDSNIKGTLNGNDRYRGLSCICLEILDEIAEQNDGILKREEIRKAENFVFSVPLTFSVNASINGDISRVLTAKPVMKQIRLNEDGKPQIFE